MAELLEELIRARECRAQVGFSAGCEKLGMDVGLVLDLYWEIMMY